MLRYALAYALILTLTLGEANAQTQLDLDVKEGAKVDQLSQRLNTVYQGLMRRYSPQDRRALRSSERAWLSYRNAGCAYESRGVEGGSAQPMIYAICVEALTEERIKHLAYQASCQEGDLSCVAPR